MTNKQQANAKVAYGDNNLIALEESSDVIKRATDINNKINALETSLVSLQAELTDINSSVESGMEQLNGSNIDLRTRVTETYKRLGEIDETYKTLSDILDVIDNGVKNLTLEIADVSEQSESELARLEKTSEQQYNALNEQNEKLALRIVDLVEHAQETHAQLTSSIRLNADTVIKLERELIDEISTLTNASQERDDKLDAKLSEAEKTIATNKASILKMQAIDNALEKRVVELEKTTDALNEKSEIQQEALQQLAEYSQELAWSVDQLRQQNENQAGQIVEIQTNASVLARTVAALAGLEKRHFWTTTGVLALLALVIGLSVYKQNTVNSIDTQNMISLKTDIESINEKLTQLDEQLESLDGRLSYVSPSSQFGKDNIIHGPQWLAKQPAHHYVIQLTSVADKNELYEIAQRYSHYLTEAMSYYSVNTPYGQRHVLVYGSFADGAQASNLLWRMPSYINQQRPMLSRVGDIQGLL